MDRIISIEWKTKRKRQSNHDSKFLSKKPMSESSNLQQSRTSDSKNTTVQEQDPIWELDPNVAEFRIHQQLRQIVG